MPRFARFVVPGVAHHITQRGSARQTVFSTRMDRRVYLGLLREQARLTELPILAYCLMSNHIHLILVPQDGAQLAAVLQRVHGRYAQYRNGRLARCGHLWQNRFSSCALGPAHLWAALRYVELNPVRAGRVERAEDWEWSSARAHLAGQDRSRLIDMEFWRREGGAENWRRLLRQSADETQERALRRATYAGQPFGDEEFIKMVRALRQPPASAMPPAAQQEPGRQLAAQA